MVDHQQDVIGFLSIIGAVSGEFPQARVPQIPSPAEGSTCDTLDFGSL
jgi:hypothetical protein